MTKAEFRKNPEYIKSMEKIRHYSKGYEFTIPYYKMTQGQRNAMMIITRDAEKEGLIESIAIGASLEDSFTEETFRRL